VTLSRDSLFAFLVKHDHGVLATVSPAGEPEAALVGVSVTIDDAGELELFFDTLDSTRKCENLRARPSIAFVIGWGDKQTAQLEGVADEPRGEELARLKRAYFRLFPDGPTREAWPGITYFRVRVRWARYSDFRGADAIVEELRLPARAASSPSAS
jgi:general stress protein 26